VPETVAEPKETREDGDAYVGTITGGLVSLQGCDYVLTLTGSETLGDCPQCGGEDFVRASLFRAGRIVAGDGSAHEDTLARRGGRGFENEQTLTGHHRSGDLSQGEREALLAEARAQVEQPGEYIVYEESGEWRTWRSRASGRGSAARSRPTCASTTDGLAPARTDRAPARRRAVLDDRSLNGVFVNGARIEGQTLQDGDEILVGRYRLSFLSVAAASR